MIILPRQARDKHRENSKNDCSLTETCAGAGSTWCPITINAWNEWSEGSYLEPDERHGMQKLAAVGSVFGPVPNRSSLGAKNAFFGAVF
jgi:hypothetical protein